MENKIKDEYVNIDGEQVKKSVYEKIKAEERRLLSKSIEELDDDVSKKRREFLKEEDELYELRTEFFDKQRRLKEIKEEIANSEEEWNEKACSLLANFEEERKLIMEGVDEKDFLLKVSEREYTRERMSEMANIEPYKDVELKEYIAELKKEMKFTRSNTRCKYTDPFLELCMPKVMPVRSDIKIDHDLCKGRMFPYDTYNIQKIVSAYFELACDNIIQDSHKVGLEESLKKIMEIKEELDFMGRDMGLEIHEDYVHNKMELLFTIYAYEEYKQRKKEENERLAAMRREEAKAQREFERERAKAEKDEATARRKIEEAMKRMEEEKNNQKELDKLKEQIEALEESLRMAIERQERAISMAQQTKHGFVYVISNIGSFGNDVYKIGLTRRLDPTERVDELSNASVPFPFDIHAMIESEDAPALETALHKAFSDNKINKMNWRKEFFNVPLEEIERVVKESGINANFIRTASAQQYRDSILYDKLK